MSKATICGFRGSYVVEVFLDKKQLCAASLNHVIVRLPSSGPDLATRTANKLLFIKKQFQHKISPETTNLF